MPLTKQYLLQHANNIESYDAIGRQISAFILRAAAEHENIRDNKSVDSIELQMTAKLKAYEPSICVSVEICLPLIGCTTIHIGATVNV